MIPTKRLAALLGLTTLVAVAGAFMPSAHLASYALDGAIARFCGLDLVIATGRRIEAERSAAAIFSVGRANVVTLRVRNRSRRVLRGTVMDDPVGDAKSSGLPATFELKPFETATIRYEIEPTRRGRRDFGAVTVRYASPLGLVARQERVAIEGHFDVYPDVHAARVLEMLRRQGRQDARVGSLRVRGGDTEFERLRPYQRGDEVRHVDWRATARREDLTVRQFQAESNQNVVFAIDIGRGMRGETGGISSVDHALNAALLTADVALRGGDRAGLVAFDDVPRTFMRPAGGRVGGRKLIRTVYDLEAGLHATDYRVAMTFLKSRVRARSLFVIFTNLLEPSAAKELSHAVRALLPQHLPLCVFLRDLSIEALLESPAQSEQELYVRAAAAESLSWRDGIMRSLRHAGVLVLDARPEEMTPSLVKRYLEVKARRLL